MSAAALVAYERSDGRYSLHHSHWGAAGMRLVEAVTPETPFGGSADRDTAPARKILAAIQAGRNAENLPRVDPGATLVNPAPTVTGAAPESLAERVDYGTVEAVYTVSLSFDVQASLAVADQPLVEGCSGVLVALQKPPARDAERLGEWIDGARSALAAVVAAGSVDSDRAGVLFRDLLTDRASGREVKSTGM